MLKLSLLSPEPVCLLYIIRAVSSMANFFPFIIYLLLVLWYVLFLLDAVLKFSCSYFRLPDFVTYLVLPSLL